ncbi:MAG: site-2 protease family protein [Dehalococcoidales bacterium]|nr:site-2 protease family protein [Dehalococcoidales bacterium]
MAITLVSFFIMLIVLVLVHELGHFITAKAFKVRVEEFGLFFPPRIWGIKRGETTYSINALPIGGFVKLAGEEDPKVPGSLSAKSKGVRILVLASGAIMNLILPVILLSIAFMVPHTEVSAPSIIKEVSPNSPAYYAGVESGDTIIEINGKTITSPNDVSRMVQLYLGTPIELTVQHVDGSIEDVALTPRWSPPAGEGAMGIEWDVDTIVAQQVVTKNSYPFWEAIPMGFQDSLDTFVLFKNGIISMIIGAEPVQFMGPVGIAQMTGEIARAGISPLLEFAAAFSINLGILNLFPLPALDGGRIVFVILEWLRRGKRISVKTESLVHAIGFLLLIAVILVISYQDIVRIITGTSLY